MDEKRAKIPQELQIRRIDSGSIVPKIESEEKVELSAWRLDLEAWGMKVIKHYFLTLGGLIVSSFGFFGQGLAFGSWNATWWGVAVFGFGNACFQSWREERRKRENERNEFSILNSQRDEEIKNLKAMAQSESPEVPLTIEFVPQPPNQAPTKIEIVNKRGDRPLKLAAVRLWGVWPDREETICDFPGMIYPEPELISDIPMEDKRIFPFPSSPAYFFRVGENLKSIYAEVELRDKRKFKSDAMTKPPAQAPDTPASPG